MRRWPLWCAVVSLFAATACAGSSTDVAPPVDVPAPRADVAVVVKEFAFAPAVVAVPAGTPFTVTLDNEGTIGHEWVIIAPGHEIAGQGDFSESDVLHEIDNTKQGQKRSGSFTIDKPGTYQVICAIEGHFAAGMHGTLVVV